VLINQTLLNTEAVTRGVTGAVVGYS